MAIDIEDASGESQEYQDFLEKFKPKKTTDDCYTPGNIYDVVKAWAVEEYGLHGRPVIRPFYPGGDYEAETYPENCVVIDNPPFSILSEICEFYNMVGIDYFLFCPALTAFSTYSGRCNYVLADANITYANGANVRTAFVTNLGPHKVLTAPDLHERLQAADRENTAGRSHPKYIYPPSVITPATLQKLVNHGVRLELDEEDLVFVRGLDAQKPFRKSIFGAGFILSEKAAAAHVDALRQAAENDIAPRQDTGLGRVHVWELSDRERELVRK